MCCEDWSNRDDRRRVLISRIVKSTLSNTGVIASDVLLLPLHACDTVPFRPPSGRLLRGPLFLPGEVFPRPSFCSSSSSSSSSHLWACPIRLLPCQERPMLALGANDRNQAGKELIVPRSRYLEVRPVRFQRNGSTTCSLPSRPPPQQPSIGQIKTKKHNKMPILDAEGRRENSRTTKVGCSSSAILQASMSGKIIQTHSLRILYAL